MGERLEKEMVAIYRARFEQIPTWQEAVRRRGGATDREAIELLIGMIGTLWNATLHLAREVDDPPHLVNGE